MSNQSENRNSNSEKIPQSAYDYYQSFKADSDTSSDDDDNDVDESIQSENLDDGAYGTTLIENSKHISTAEVQSLPAEFRDYVLKIKSGSPSYLFDFRQFASCSIDDLNASVKILIDEYSRNSQEIQFYRNVFKHIEQKARQKFPINAVFSTEMKKIKSNSNWDEIVMFGTFLCECYKIRAVDDDKIEQWIENLRKNGSENSTIAFLLILNRLSMDSNFLQTKKWKTCMAIVRKLAGFDDDHDDQMRSNSIDETSASWCMRDEQQIPAQQEVQQDENSSQLSSNSRICSEYKKSLENSTKFNYNNFEYMTDDETNDCVKILIDKIITHPKKINQFAIGVRYYADMLQTLRSLPKDVIKACEATIDKHGKEKFSSITSWHLINLGKFFGELYAIDMTIIDTNFLIDWIETLLSISNENSFESLVETMKYCHRKFRFEDDVNFDQYLKMLKSFAVKDSHKAIIEEIEAQMTLDDISPPDVFWTQEPQPTIYVRRVNDFRAFVQYLSYDQDDNIQKFDYDSIFDWDYVNRKTNARFIERKMMEKRVDVLKLAKFLKNMFMLSFSFGRFIKTLKANLLKRVKTFSISTPLNELRNIGIFVSTITNMYVIDKHLLRAFLVRIKKLNPIGNEELLRVELDVLRVALLDIQMHDSEKFDEYLNYLVDVGENSEISADNRSNVVRILKNFSDYDVPSVFVELIWKSIKGHRLNSMSSEEYADLTDYKELARIFFMHAISNSHMSAYFANAMSQLCSHDEEGKKFKTQIIYRCQKSFERHHKTEKIIDNDFNEDEAIGTAIFIAELVRRQFLTEKIVISCMNILDEASDDSKVSYECFGILIKMTKNVFRDENNKKYVNELEVKLKNKKIPLKPHNLRTMREASTSSQRSSIASQNSLNSSQNDSSTNEVYIMFSQFLSELTQNNSKDIAQQMKPILLYKDENCEQYAKIIKNFGYENPLLLPSLISLVDDLQKRRTRRRKFKLNEKIETSLQDDLTDILLNENSPLRENLKNFCGFFKSSYSILTVEFIFNIWNQLLTHVKLNNKIALLILNDLMQCDLKTIFDTTRAVHAGEFLLVSNNQIKLNHSEEINDNLRMHTNTLERILSDQSCLSQNTVLNSSNELNVASSSANLQSIAAINELQRTSDDPYERFAQCLSELNLLPPKKVAKNELFFTMDSKIIAKIIKNFAYKNPHLIPSILILIQNLQGRRNLRLLKDQIEESLQDDLLEVLSNENSSLHEIVPNYCQLYAKMFKMLPNKNVLKVWNLLLSHVKLNHKIALYILVNIIDANVSLLKGNKQSAMEFSNAFNDQLKTASSVELKNKLQKLIISLDRLTCSDTVPMMRSNILTLNQPTKFEDNSENLVILQSQLNRQSASTSSENQSNNSTQQFSQILNDLTDSNLNDNDQELRTNASSSSTQQLSEILNELTESNVNEITEQMYNILRNAKTFEQYAMIIKEFSYKKPQLSGLVVEIIKKLPTEKNFNIKLLKNEIDNCLQSDLVEILWNEKSPLREILPNYCQFYVSMYEIISNDVIINGWSQLLTRVKLNNKIALFILVNLMNIDLKLIFMGKNEKEAKKFSTVFVHQLTLNHSSELSNKIEGIVRRLNEITPEEESALNSSNDQYENFSQILNDLTNSNVNEIVDKISPIFQCNMVALRKYAIIIKKFCYENPQLTASVIDVIVKIQAKKQFNIKSLIENIQLSLRSDLREILSNGNSPLRENLLNYCTVALNMRPLVKRKFIFGLWELAFTFVNNFANEVALITIVNLMSEELINVFKRKKPKQAAKYSAILKNQQMLIQSNEVKEKVLEIIKSLDGESMENQNEDESSDDEQIDEQNSSTASSSQIYQNSQSSNVNQVISNDPYKQFTQILNELAEDNVDDIVKKISPFIFPSSYAYEQYAITIKEFCCRNPHLSYHAVKFVNKMSTVKGLKIKYLKNQLQPLLHNDLIKILLNEKSPLRKDVSDYCKIYVNMSKLFKHKRIFSLFNQILEQVKVGNEIGIIILYNLMGINLRSIFKKKMRRDAETFLAVLKNQLITIQSEDMKKKITKMIKAFEDVLNVSASNSACIQCESDSSDDDEQIASNNVVNQPSTSTAASSLENLPKAPSSDFSFEQILNTLSKSNVNDVMEKISKIIVCTPEAFEGYAKIFVKFCYDNSYLTPTVVNLIIRLLHIKKVNVKCLIENIQQLLQNDLIEIILNEDSKLKKIMSDYCMVFVGMYKLMRKKFIFNIWNQILTYVKMNDEIALFILVNLMDIDLRIVFKDYNENSANEFSTVFKSQLKKRHYNELKEKMEKIIKMLDEMNLKEAAQKGDESSDDDNWNDMLVVQPTTSIDPYEQFTIILNDLNNFNVNEMVQKVSPIIECNLNDLEQFAIIIKEFCYENPQLSPAVVEMIRLLLAENNFDTKPLRNKIQQLLNNDLNEILSKNSPLREILSNYCQFYVSMYKLLPNEKIIDVWNQLLTRVKLNNKISLTILINLMDTDLKLIFIGENKKEAKKFSTAFRHQLTLNHSAQLMDTIRALLRPLDSISLKNNNDKEQPLSDAQKLLQVNELFNELQQKPLREVKNLILKMEISPTASFQQRAILFCKVAMETDRNLKLLAPLLKFICDEIIKKPPKDDPLLKAVVIELSKHMNSTEKILQVSKIYGEFFNHGLVSFDWIMSYLRMPIEENLPSLGLKIVYEVMEITFSHMIVVLLNDEKGNSACASNASTSSPEISNIEIFMEIYEKFKYCTRPMDSAFSETLMYDKIKDNFEVIKLQITTQNSKLQESNSTANNAYINSSNIPSTSSKSLNLPKQSSKEPKSTTKTSKLIPSTSQSQNVENYTTPVEIFEELSENNFEASSKRLSTIKHNENATNYDEIIEIFIKIYFHQPFSNDHANLLVKLLKNSRNTFVDHLINQFQHYCIVFITSDEKYRENFIEIIEIIDVMCRFYHNGLISLDFIAQCIEIYLDKTQKFDTAYDYIYKTLKSTGGDFELSKKDEIDKYFKFFNHIIVINGKQAKSCAELIELRKDRFISFSSINYDIFERFIDGNVSVSTIRLYIHENNTNVDEFMEMIWKVLMKSPQKAIQIANAVNDLSRFLNSLQKCLIEFMERRRRTFLGILRKDFTPKIEERLKFSIIFIIELHKLRFLTEDLDDWLLPRLIKKLTKYEDKFEIFTRVCSIKYDITNERLEIFIKNLEESMRESQNYTFGEMKNDLNELMKAIESNLNVEEEKEEK